MPPPNDQGASAAVTQATRVSDIGFASFTSQLITDTFAALIDANAKQTQTYLDLVKTVALTLTDFSADRVSDAAIEQFLRDLGLWPLPSTWSQEAKDKLQEAVATSADLDPTGNVVDFSRTGDELVKIIYAAIRKKIAEPSYAMLRELVRLGVLRVIVDAGLIETRLTFSTWGVSSSGQTKQTRESWGGTAGIAGGGAGIGGILSTSPIGAALGAGAIGGGGGVHYNKVSTANSWDRDSNGSAVQIFGRVELRFKTDYLPLKP